ncbi:MAG: beta-N-acetylhexosaminidase [Candidatus Euphemobacter frigidus]|nr:beta-N-acetylhexosaminidase [Candidatus Euphemobacter frigidus]
MKLENMMNDFKLGELLMVGFEGYTLNKLLRRYIREWQVGGVILFGRNIRNPDQVAELCGKLAELRSQVSDLPLLIAVDQEGGTVARLREGVTNFPGNLALGFGGTVDNAFHQGLITGYELLYYGFNMNLAPVLDLYSNQGSHSLGLRSLGSDPHRAARLGVALIKGMQKAGIVATAKHFPGKGSARRDSHEELPVIGKTVRELKRRDLLPFRAVIDAGVKAIMTSHAAYPAFEGGVLRPATLSRLVMTLLLREELHFPGLLISDDLGMGALRSGYSIEEAALKALKAGVDMLLLCHDPLARERVLDALKRISKGDRLIRERLKESGKRISTLKEGLLPSPRSPSFDQVPEHDLPLKIARGAISVRKSAGDVLPLEKGSRFLLIWFKPELGAEVEDPGERDGEPGKHLRAEGLSPKVLPISLCPSPEKGERILDRLRAVPRVVITSYDAYRYPDQRRLIEDVLERRPGAVLAVLRDPRDLELFPRARTVLITRGYGPPSIQALAETLSGKLKPRREG